MRALIAVVVSAVVGLAAVGAGGPPSERTDRAPFIRVLGTAQDGGLPHAGCTCVHCEIARKDPGRRRLVSSLAIVVPAGEREAAAEDRARVFLIDCTPDVREQLDRLRDVRPSATPGVDRSPVDGILLTHAHIGHYLGLAFLGFEAISSPGVPVWCTTRMGGFLRENGPWSQLVRLKNIAIREIVPDTSFELAPGVRVTPHAVPHRDEFSDTVGFLIGGPSRRVLYVPDTEPWRTWTRGLTEYLDSIEGGVQVLIVDGTFYSPDELPGRHAASIGHPLMTDTMDLLQERVRGGGLEVYFTHLNHSNPALEPDGPARAEIERRGFHVLEDGARLGL